MRVTLGLREVLDDPCIAAAEWERLGGSDRLRDLVNEVWVHGNPAIHDPVATGEAPPVLAGRTRFIGYLVNDRCVSDHGEPVESRLPVLATAGGGSDDHEPLRTAVAIRAPAGYENIVVTGPQLDDVSFGAIAAQATPGAQAHRSWPGLGGQIAEVIAVISMDGYNTAHEILATDTLALVISRETPRLKQLIRVEALHDARAFDMMCILQVTAEALGVWATSIVMRRTNHSHISRDGLVATAGFAADLLNDANPAIREVVA